MSAQTLFSKTNNVKMQMGKLSLNLPISASYSVPGIVLRENFLEVLRILETSKPWSFYHSIVSMS